MNKFSAGILLLILGALFSCKDSGTGTQERPVARVGTTYMYPSDLAEHLQQGLSVEDSSKAAKRLIEEWVRNELLLKQAETNLPEDEKNVTKQVEEYRTSLLIFKYKQILLSRNLDTIIPEREIKAYYDENSSNYILSSDLVKATYVKIPLTAPDISKVRSLYRSEKEDDLRSLEDYCTTYGRKCMIGDDRWIRFTDLISETPLNIDNPGRYLNYNHNIETSDSHFYHFIHILERVPEGQIAPFDYVRENIRSVLMNKRKIEYLQDLENTVYKEGLSRNQVEIY
jgi:hypothetical protein